MSEEKNNIYLHHNIYLHRKFLVRKFFPFFTFVIFGNRIRPAIVGFTAYMLTGS